ncbi:MAG: chemotaxis protein CheW [Myxococcales bacterium]|nr:chemotaxis protein CheW [Myxococcales bacterium]
MSSSEPIDSTDPRACADRSGSPASGGAPSSEPEGAHPAPLGELPPEEELLARIDELDAELRSLRRLTLLAPEPPPTDPFEALQFAADGRWFLIPIDSVREVVEMVRPQPMVDAPPFVLGTIRFGPLSVPLIDLGARLSERPAALRPDDVLLLLDSPRWIALAVSEVRQVVHVQPDHLAPPPAGLRSAPFIVATYAPREGGTLPVLSADRVGRELCPDDA